MKEKPNVFSHGHLQVIGARGNRRWRAFWWDADGKHSRVLGLAWAQNSGKRTPRGAIVWHAADGPKPDPAHLTPRDAQAELRRLLESEAAKRPTPRSARGTPVTFADAAEAWLVFKYWLSNLPADTELTDLVGLGKMRWRIEHDYRELKDALGLDHFEGRTHPGWNHHVTLVAVAQAFLTLERQRRPQARAAA